MTQGFFRYPHTPHFAWLGDGSPRGDKILSPKDREELLNTEVIVEEKVDGANLGISAIGREIFIQNRGDYLRKPFPEQFKHLSTWLSSRKHDLISILGDNLILFGEWCAAQHSIRYDKLPDWFLIFDVYDQTKKQFWSTTKRNELATLLDLQVIKEIFRGTTTPLALKTQIINTPSSYYDGKMEGIVIRKESGDKLDAKAKIVQPNFIQGINDHWRKNAIQWNKLQDFKA